MADPTYQNPTFGKIKTKTAEEVTEVDFLSTVETDGSIAKIQPVNLIGLNNISVAYVESNGNDSTAQIGNSRKAFLTIDAALDALPSTGGVVKIGVGTFNSPARTKIKDNVKFIGSGKPYPNITVSYPNNTDQPVMSKPTKLVGGTVLNGEFNISEKNNINVSYLGVDVGKDWSDSNGGVLNNAFMTYALNNSLPNTSNPPTKGLVVNNVSALCLSSTALVHAVLIENTINASITNVSTFYGYHGLVIKSVGTSVDGAECYGHDGEGVIIKADNYAYCNDVNISNVYISSIEPNDGGGFMFDGGSGSLRRITANNVKIAFTKWGVTDTSTDISDISINNFNIYKTNSNGVYFGPFTKKLSLSNIIQNHTIAGSGIELVTTSGDTRNIINASTDNSYGIGIYLNASSGGIINALNLKSNSNDDTGITILGTVYGANVKSDKPMSGSLSFETGDSTLKSLTVTNGASNTIGLGSDVFFSNGLTGTSLRSLGFQLNSTFGLDLWKFDSSNWINTGIKLNNSGTISAQPATTGLEVINYNQFISAVTPGVKRYKALISQTGTSAPTAIVLENSLGTVTFGYSSAATYTVNSSGLFTANKTALYMTSKSASNGIGLNQLNANTLNLLTQSDGFLSNTTLLIEVYP